MDESLTEDDFYAGPLRGIFGHLSRQSLLQDVHILILDGLSVPADLVREIVSEDRYNVRILSIREAKNLNQTKLQQVLRYAMRPTRREGTPKLRALYIFGPRDMPLLSTSKESRPEQRGSHDYGVTTAVGAQIGARWNHVSSVVLQSTLPDNDQAKWYGRSGRVLRRPQSDWPDTLQVCHDVIAFDAILCRGPRHDISKVSSVDFLPPTIATVALGPTGCEACGGCPEGPAVFGQSHQATMPLLSPPPIHAATARAAQRPDTVTGAPPPLFLRCEDCLRGRWCERCDRFWCEDCYVEPVSRAQSHTLQQAAPEYDLAGGWDLSGQGSPIKVYSKLCVERCLVNEMMMSADGYWG